MSVQTSYDYRIKNGYHGQLGNLITNTVITGTLDQSASASITPGTGVSIVPDSTGDRLVLPGVYTQFASIKSFTGISVRDLANEVVAGDIVYEKGDVFPVLQEGYIYLEVVAGGDAGAPLKMTGAGIIDTGVAGVGEFQLDAVLHEKTTAARIGLVHLRSLQLIEGS